jgi:hypothetical protein
MKPKWKDDMRKPFLPSLICCMLLAGCGTLKVDVDYGWTPAGSGSETAPSESPRPVETVPVSGATHTSDIMPSPSWVLA